MGRGDLIGDLPKEQFVDETSDSEKFNFYSAIT